MRQVVQIATGVLLGIVMTSCQLPTDNSTGQKKSSTKAVTTFSFSSPAVTGTITEPSHTISVLVPFGTDVSALSPQIVHTGASIVPGSNVSQDFRSVVSYTVTAEDQTTQVYSVTVSINSQPSSYTSANVGTLVGVPSGSFSRDAGTINKSWVTGFRIGINEITAEQFTSVTGLSNPSSSFTSISNGPVQSVSWYHAIYFCNKLSVLEGLIPVYSVNGSTDPATWGTIPVATNSTWDSATADWSASGYRLPTEMEWMWAAMGAGKGSISYNKAFSGSDGSNVISDYGWTATNGANTTHTVGQKLPNELGIYDLTGNVNEWVWDWYATYPSGEVSDFRGPASGTYRVARGGDFAGIPNQNSYTLDFQNGGSPFDQSNKIGFRIARR